MQQETRVYTDHLSPDPKDLRVRRQAGDDYDGSGDADGDYGGDYGNDDGGDYDGDYDDFDEGGRRFFSLSPFLFFNFYPCTLNKLSISVDLCVFVLM